MKRTIKKMQQTNLLGLVLLAVLGITVGALISPLRAQQQAPAAAQQTCFVGEASNAVCSGKWIYFAGNTSAVDSGVWIVRADSETGEIWFRNGRNLVPLETQE